MARTFYLLEGDGMTKHRVRIGLHLTATDVTDDLDAFTDSLMDELVNLNDEADMGGSVTDGYFDVWVTVHAENGLEALQLASVIVKTAAHAAGGQHSGLQVPTEWPGWIHEVSLASELVEA